MYAYITVYIYIWAQLVCPKINHNPTHEIVTWQHGLCPQQMTSVLPYAAVPLHIQENDVRSTISKVAWFPFCQGHTSTRNVRFMIIGILNLKIWQISKGNKALTVCNHSAESLLFLLALEHTSSKRTDACASKPSDTKTCSLLKRRVPSAKWFPSYADFYRKRQEENGRNLSVPGCM